MDNPRPEKVAIVEEVKANFEASNAVVLTEYRGLDVDAMSALRGALREAGGDYKIYKNTLAKFAAKDLGLEIDALLTGPTAIAFVTRTADGEPGDTVTVAKALKDFAKDNESLVIKGGLLGDKLLAPADIMKLADVAPRDELLARFAGGLAAPMQRFAGLLQAVPRSFAYGLAALIADGGAGEAGEAASVDETEESSSDAAEAPAEAAPEASADAEGEAEDSSAGTDASAEDQTETASVDGADGAADEDS